MKKQLRKPENWQDFESLCKNLWGEVWHCPEIKKNGRSGQNQHGVDIYGVPMAETAYYGIQCKGKDDYTNSNLTSNEIDEEIEKAQSFKPFLKKFYFATTGNKDARIEEYVRIKDLQSRKAKGFDIYLFSWEDIVDLIDENKRTHDWYVNNMLFKSSPEVTITFGNGESHLNFQPTLIKNTVSYKFPEPPQGIYNNPLNVLKYGSSNSNEELMNPQPNIYHFRGQSVNKSSCTFHILLENTGSVPLENFKMYLKFPETGILTDTVDKTQKFSDFTKYEYNTHRINTHINYYVFEPNEPVLVQTDKILTDRICLRPTIEHPQLIIVNYEFLAKDYAKKGELIIELINSLIEDSCIEESFHHQQSIIRLDNYLE